jgi:hypothetical protein
LGPHDAHGGFRADVRFVPDDISYETSSAKIVPRSKRFAYYP